MRTACNLSAFPRPIDRGATHGQISIDGRIDLPSGPEPLMKTLLQGNGGQIAHANITKKIEPVPDSQTDALFRSDMLPVVFIIGAEYTRQGYFGWFCLFRALVVDEPSG
jgi:hypothetical protein